MLPERISKEPLGPFVRQGDEVWGKIVHWTLSVMIEAEELGVTQAKVDELARSGTAPQKRLRVCDGNWRWHQVQSVPVRNGPTMEGPGSV